MGIGCAIRGRAIEITGGALSQAEAGYRQLIELYPTASAFHYRYALVLRALGNPQAAYDEMMRDIPPYRQAGLPLARDALGRRAGTCPNEC